MSGVVPPQFFRSKTSHGGSYHDLSQFGGTPASNNTVASYGNLGTGSTLLDPEETENTRTSVPAATDNRATALPYGWALDVPVDPDSDGDGATSEDRVIIDSNGPITMDAVWGASVGAVTAQVHAIMYAAPAMSGLTVREIARGTNQLGIVPTSLTPFSIVLSPVTANLGSNVEYGHDALIFVSLFVQVTLGGVSLGGYEINLQTNNGAGTAFNAGSIPLFRYRLIKNRSTSQGVVLPTHTAQRQTDVWRRTDQGLVVPTDTPSRVADYHRFPEQDVLVQADDPTRVVEYHRTPSEDVDPPAADPSRVVDYHRQTGQSIGTPDQTPLRVVEYHRLPEQEVPVPNDLPIRSVNYPRSAEQDIDSQIADAIRVVTFRRVGEQDVAVIVDTASRVVTATRVAEQDIEAITDLAERSITYGRSVRYDFQPSDPEVIDPQREIRVTVYDGDTGDPHGAGALVVLFRSDTNFPVQQATTDETSIVAFPRNSFDSNDYWVAAWDTDGVPLSTQSVSPRTLKPTEV